jgi:uncharacterized cupredoxin-like copper-binding protein
MATDKPNSLTGTIMFVLVTFLVIAGVTIAGLLVRPSGALDVPKGDHVAHVSLSDYAVNGPASLPAGKYEVVITNRGTVPHELVIFGTKRTAAALPLQKDGSVDEESGALTNVLDSGSSLAPGETRVVFADLTSPGHYAMVCNLAGHYHLGMHADLTVS